MTEKRKAGHIMAYMLIVLLLFLIMTTAISFTAVGAALPLSEPSSHTGIGIATIHNGLGDPGSAEILDEIYPTWDIQLEYQAERDSYIVSGVSVSIESDCPSNVRFVYPESALLKLDPGIITAFLQDKDGMK